MNHLNIVSLLLCLPLIFAAGCVHDISSDPGFVAFKGKCYSLTHNTLVMPSGVLAEYGAVQNIPGVDTPPPPPELSSRGALLLPLGTKLRILALYKDDRSGLLLPEGRLIDGQLAGHTLELIGLLHFDLVDGKGIWRPTRLAPCTADVSP